MCVPWELNPQPFDAANAMLYHWATGTELLYIKNIEVNGMFSFINFFFLEDLDTKNMLKVLKNQRMNDSLSLNKSAFS